MSDSKNIYTKEQIEEIKNAFKEEDITEGYALKPEFDMTPEEAEVFNRTKRLFKKYWSDNLKEIGINRPMQNYSGDHPVNMLMNTDGNIFGELITEITDIFEEAFCEDDETEIENENNENIEEAETDSEEDVCDVEFDIAEFFNSLREDAETDEETSEMIDIFENIYKQYSNVINIGLNKYAKSIGKDISELEEEEILFVFDSVFDVINKEQIKAFMYGQQVPELYDISHKNAVIEDFNENQKENHPKIDFLRKQYGLRRKFDCLLSFEELTENDLVGLNPEDEISESDFDKILVGFLNTLDETDRMICYMKMDGKTQYEIAQELGYKNHSAVTKRMAKIKEKIPAYIEKAV